MCHIENFPYSSLYKQGFKMKSFFLKFPKKMWMCHGFASKPIIAHNTEKTQCGTDVERMWHNTQSINNYMYNNYILYLAPMLGSTITNYKNIIGPLLKVGMVLR